MNLSRPAGENLTPFCGKPETDASRPPGTVNGPALVGRITSFVDVTKCDILGHPVGPRPGPRAAPPAAGGTATDDIVYYSNVTGSNCSATGTDRAGDKKTG